MARDTPGVIAPPPAIALAVVIAGLALDRLTPIGVTAAVFPYSARLTFGAVFVMWSAWALSRALIRFRLAGTPPEPWKPTTALVSRGIYSRTRNPIYQAFGLFVLGVAFAFASDWTILLLPPGALVMHVFVVRREERYLEARFGESYREFAAKVPRYGWPV